MRTIISYFIGLGNYVMVKKCIDQIIKFNFFTMILISIMIYFFKDFLSYLFFTDEDVMMKFTNCLIIFSISLIQLSTIPLFSGMLR